MHSLPTSTAAAADFDAITQAQLRRIGGYKWSKYPEATGMFVAEMDFGLAPVIADRVSRLVADGLVGYPPTSLIDEMKQACAGWHQQQYGWDVDAEMIRPTADVLSALLAVIDVFTNPSTPVIVPTPAYMPFLTLPSVSKRQVIEVPMQQDADGWHLDLDRLDAAFAQGAQLLVLCNPHNPIGKVYSRAEMLAISEVVERHGGLVFSDEIHAPIVYPGSQHIPYASVSEGTSAHSITATAASKAWNIPGLKCAQLMFSTSAQLTRWDADLRGTVTEHGASNIGLAATTAAYTEGQPWLATVVDYLDRNRTTLKRLVTEALPGARYSVPEGTYLAWLDLQELGLGDEPWEFFLDEAGVACTNGAECGAVGRGHLRLNFATPTPILMDALGRMGEALSRRG